MYIYIYTYTHIQIYIHILCAYMCLSSIWGYKKLLLGFKGRENLLKDIVFLLSSFHLNWIFEIWTDQNKGYFFAGVLQNWTTLSSRCTLIA